MIILNYHNKTELRNSIGLFLSYSENRVIHEYKRNGIIVGSNREFVNGSKLGILFFAQITMENGTIKDVR